jgi:hypothetical protein
MGKTEAMRKELAAYLKKHPQAVVAYVGKDGTRIEKPIDGEVVGLDLLPLLGKGNHRG